MHEIGHTGGLVHPWDFNKKFSFLSGEPVQTNEQEYVNSSGDENLESNFMNYTTNAIDNSDPMRSRESKKRYFNSHVGAATQGQIQQIINNLLKGILNYDNIPKQKN